MLLCVGEVREHAVLRVMHGEAAALVEAARSATDQSLERAAPDALVLLMDCISRQLFLSERFDEELAAVEASLARRMRHDAAMGALTLGEVASMRDGMPAFHNKTVVVAALGGNPKP